MPFLSLTDLGCSISLHSWVGLVSVALMALQVVGGLLFYLVPIFPFSIRARVLPLHGQLQLEKANQHR